MSVLRRQVSTIESDVDSDGSWAISYGDMITLLLSFFVLFFSTDNEADRLNAMENSLLLALNHNVDAQPQSITQAGQDPMMTEELLKQVSAKAHKVGSKLIVEFPNTSFFDSGKIDLTPQGHQELVKFIKIYMPYAGNYILGIRAFTDIQKVIQRPHQPFRDNLELSALRSVSTMRQLQHLGIPLKQMRISGYGERNVNGDLAFARKIVIIIEPQPREVI